jgi:hypothetical protein
MRPLALFAGFVLVGLSPSFLDWNHADERERKQIVLYYSAAGVLVWFGSRK